MAKIIQPYINADDIERSIKCKPMEAAVQAFNMRKEQVEKGLGFSFETVLSTNRNLDLLEEAKEKGFFIRGYYILTADVTINILRVKSRVRAGGHDVPEDKIVSRYKEAMKLIPSFIKVCDICHIYDNSGDYPYRIFKKGKDKYFFWFNYFWKFDKISELTKIPMNSENSVLIGLSP